MGRGESLNEKTNQESRGHVDTEISDVHVKVSRLWVYDCSIWSIIKKLRLIEMTRRVSIQRQGNIYENKALGGHFGI